MIAVQFVRSNLYAGPRMAAFAAVNATGTDIILRLCLNEEGRAGLAKS